MAQTASQAGPGGWLYRFDMPVQNNPGWSKLGATHAAEIPFTFNNFAGTSSAPMGFYDKDDPSVRKLAENWSNTIITFARTGDPNGAGLPYWPRYSPDSQKTLILDAEPRIEP